MRASIDIDRVPRYAVLEVELYRECKIVGAFNKIVPLLKRLISRPYLARAVQRVDIGKWRTFANPDFPHRPLYEPDHDDYQMFTQAALAAGIIETSVPLPLAGEFESKLPWCETVVSEEPLADIPYDTRFCHLLSKGFEDPYIVLFVSLLSNVREIIFRDLVPSGDALPWHLPIHGFAKLRKIRVGAREPAYLSALTQFQELIQSTPIEALESYSTNDDASYWEDAGGSPCRPLFLTGELSITRLALDGCWTMPGDMTMLIRACRTLKSFRYLPHIFCNTSLPTRELLKLLRAHKDTLEDLSLISWIGSGDSFDIDSLVEFQSLKRLEATGGLWPRLVSTSGSTPVPTTERIAYRLPSSLEELTLHEDWTAMNQEHLKDILSLQDSRFPNLRTLTIASAYSDEYKELNECAGRVTLKVLCHEGLYSDA